MAARPWPGERVELTTPHGTDHATALELERLRGELNQHMASLKSDIEVIKTQSSHAEQDRQDQGRKLDGLDRRVTTLERKIWFAAGIVATFGTVIGWLSHYIAGGH